jgi:carboxypeptidase C (cathepsin A)
MAKKKVKRAKSHIKHAKARIKHAIRKALKRGREAPKSRLEVVYRSREFGKAPVEKRFVLHDGRQVESLFQLIDELETMGEDVFRHHVNEMKNDFANWARDVFAAPSLAEEMQKMRDRMETQRAVMKHLLREVAQVASKEHREEVKQQVKQEKKIECKKTSKGVRCVIK